MKKKVVDVITGEVEVRDFTGAEIAAAQAIIDAEAAKVPDVLTPAQFWMQMAIDGDETAALAIIDTLTRPQQILALRARDYRRDNTLLIQLATALGKNSAAIDTFFREAYKL